MHPPRRYIAFRTPRATWKSIPSDTIYRVSFWRSRSHRRIIEKGRVSLRDAESAFPRRSRWRQGRGIDRSSPRRRPIARRLSFPRPKPARCVIPYSSLASSARCARFSINGTSAFAEIASTFKSAVIRLLMHPPPSTHARVCNLVIGCTADTGVNFDP